MEDWFISDPHWGHPNIIKYSNRPFSNVDEMNEHMVQQWNYHVKPTDRIHCLGDWSFMKPGPTKAINRRLNGQLHLILGNHDRWIIENWNDLLDQKLFSSIQYYKELKVSGMHLCLFHYGQRVWNKSHHGSIHLYGHSHGSLPPHGKSVDVGVDCKEITSEYRPIQLEEIRTYMSKRVQAKVDHHGED